MQLLTRYLISPSEECGLYFRDGGGGWGVTSLDLYFKKITLPDLNLGGQPEVGSWKVPRISQEGASSPTTGLPGKRSPATREAQRQAQTSTSELLSEQPPSVMSS